MTFECQMDDCIVFRRPESTGNEVSNLIIAFLFFFCTFLARFCIHIYSKLAKMPISLEFIFF